VTLTRPSELPLLAEIIVDVDGGWGFVSAVQGPLTADDVESLDDWVAGGNFDTPLGSGTYLVKPEFEDGDENNASGWYCTLVAFIKPLDEPNAEGAPEVADDGNPF